MQVKKVAIALSIAAIIWNLIVFLYNPNNYSTFGLMGGFIGLAVLYEVDKKI